MITSPPMGLIETYKRWPVEFVSGSGAKLIDTEGREYIDLLAGIAVASVGHSHPHVVAAVSDQAADLMHVSNLFYTRPGMELAARLFDLTGMSAFFCNSGAEAIECALKLVRRWAGKEREVAAPQIVAAHGGFHGRTFGALSATGQPLKQEPFAPLVPGFTHVAFGDVAALEAAMTPDVVAVLLEPIQGEAGVIVPPDDYLPKVRALCDRSEALLVLDEIQTGLGRTGKWFAYQHTGIQPDVMCLAKGLAGGLPIGACLATSRVAEAFELGDHGSTFGAGPVQSAAALAVLDVIEKEGLVERSAALGETLKEKLSAIFGEEATVRGKGLMIGVQLDQPLAAEFTEAALKAGVIVNNATTDVVRLVPPLVITEAEIDAACEILGEVWREMSASRKA